MPFYIAKGELSHVAIVRGPWSMVGVGEQCCTLCGSRREGQLVFNLIFITAGLIMWKENVELGSRQLLDVAGEATVASHTAELLEKWHDFRKLQARA